MLLLCLHDAVQSSLCSCQPDICDAPGEGKGKFVHGDDVQATGYDASEFDLDDEELLAMAATQLEGS